jgi:hypothetical protein
MKCQKCGSENVNVQLINKQELMNLKEKKGCLWWVAIGWWWVPIKWFFLYFILGLLVIPFKMLLPKKKQIINTVEGYKVCNNCGHHWE